MDQALQKAITDAHTAARALALAASKQKNAALEAMREEIFSSRESHEEILAANAADMAAAASANPQDPMLDRLLLTPERLAAIANDLENVIRLPDPVGEVMDTRTRPNGLRIERIRVPIGTVLMIYESRPNVTVDSTALAIKSGNAIVLKGGKEALQTNRALVEAMKRGLRRVQNETGVPPEAICFVETIDRSVVGELLNMRGVIDVAIPRGGKGLIDFVVCSAHIPVIETGASVVHIFVDEKADIQKALDIVVNAKTRRVGICNALDVLLVHENIAEKFVRTLAKALQKSAELHAHPIVELRCDEAAMCILKSKKCGKTPEEACDRDANPYPGVAPLDPEKDYDTEFLDYVLAIHVVDSLDEAIAHIARHSLKHSEAIVTEDARHAERFLREVDTACVYHNASTQFSDGAQFGLGAEMGISTQKLHARGPFALEGLTTYKWVIHGNGQVRPV